MSEQHPSLARPKPTFSKYLATALPVIIGVSLLTLALDYYGWLERFETGALDRFIILQERVPASHVAIVEIDNDDYEQLFDEKSPLDPCTLYDLIDAIALNQPKLIAVDIDTSAKVFKELKTQNCQDLKNKSGGDTRAPAKVSKELKSNSEWPPIVWARGASEGVGAKQESGDHSENEEIFVLEKVLGEESAPPNSLTGIALLPLDSDNQIRHFRREYPIASGQTTSQPPAHADSFHWAVVRKYCELSQNNKRCEKLFGPQAEKSDEHDLVLNLAIDPYAFETSIRASKVLAEATPENLDTGTPAFLSLKDKIVILGGKYDAARDDYDTPVGMKHGVELAAIAIESELSGFGIHRVNHFVLIILELLAGVLLVALNYKFPRGWRRLIALAAIPIFALLGSYIAFSSLALWANFIPMLMGVQLHFLYDKLAETKHLEKEVQGLQQRLKQYEQPVQAAPLEVPGRAEDEQNEISPVVVESEVESEKAESENTPPSIEKDTAISLPSNEDSSATK